MAGDWIKMRSNLWNDPRIARLVDLTSTTEAAVIGGLYWLWATADQHTETGLLPGLSTSAIDRKTSVKGLGAALVEIGWIKEMPEGVCIERFDEHNSESAKRRSVDAKRKAAERIQNSSPGRPSNVHVTTGQKPDRFRRVSEPEEEKEREEEKIKSIAIPIGIDAPAVAEATTLRVVIEKEKKGPQRIPKRIPEDWMPSEADVRFAREHRAQLDLDLEIEKFRSYWTGATNNATSPDWSAKWRTWILNDAFRAGAPKAQVQNDRSNAARSMFGNSQAEIIDV